MNFRSIFGKKSLLVLLLLVSLFGVFSCARDSGEPRIFTGKTLTRNEILSKTAVTNFGKFNYAEVNSEWLKWCYPKFKSKIGEGSFGVLNWDDKSQCTYFTTAFEEFAQRTYFAHAFHDFIKAPGIAVAAFWYNPAPTGDGHALILVFTENGRQFFEPQTGKFLQLTNEQIKSAYLIKFD